MSKLPQPWTEDELAILSDLSLSPADVAARTGRSETAARVKRSNLGLSRRLIRTWSDEDLAFIRAHWREMDDRRLAARLGRSVMAIQRARQAMDLRRRGHRPDEWSEEELDTLRANWREKSDRELTFLIARSVPSIISARRRLGLRRPKRRKSWTDKEIALLRAMWKNHEDEQIAKTLGRSVESVRHRRLEMGLDRNTLPTPVERARNVFEAVILHGTDDGWEPRGEDDTPTEAMPGTPEKLRALMNRARRGVELWHEDDAGGEHLGEMRGEMFEPGDISSWEVVVGRESWAVSRESWAVSRG